MFPKFSLVLAAIEDLKERRIIEDYAVFGAIAQLFWDEAIPTFDLDVLVLYPAKPGLVTLSPLYEWAKEKGFPAKDVHIYVGEIPVQFVPVPDVLHEEAVKNAATLDLDGVPIRVVRPEYLIAIWLQPPANTPARKERIAKLRESGRVDEGVLCDVMTRFKLSW